MTDHYEYQWYILEVNPEPWSVGQIGYARKGGKMTAYMGRNAQLDAYKEAVREELLTKNPLLLEGKIHLQFFFWRRMDDYETAQGKRARKHEADLTNMQKATEDALQGILFKNDKDVISVRAHLVEQGTDTFGRVVVGVSNKSMSLDYPFDLVVKSQSRPPKAATQLEGQLDLYRTDEDLF